MPPSPLHLTDIPFTQQPLMGDHPSLNYNLNRL
jgi:hypothetical protein